MNYPLGWQVSEKPDKGNPLFLVEFSSNAINGNGSTIDIGKAILPSWSFDKYLEVVKDSFSSQYSENSYKRIGEGRFSTNGNSSYFLEFSFNQNGSTMYNKVVIIYDGIGDFYTISYQSFENNATEINEFNSDVSTFKILSTQENQTENEKTPKTYTDIENRFSLSYPEGWQIQNETGAGPGSIALVNGPFFGLVNGRLNITKIHFPLNLDDFVRFEEKTFVEKSGTKIGGNQSLPINGMEAFSFDFSSNENGVEMYGKVITIKGDGGIFYLLSYESPKGISETEKNEVEKIINSFQIYSTDEMRDSFLLVHGTGDSQLIATEMLGKENLNETRVLVIPSDLTQDAGSSLADNEGLLDRFVSSGHVLLVFSQNETGYDWIPRGFTQDRFSGESVVSYIVKEGQSMSIDPSDLNGIKIEPANGTFATKGNITTVVQEKDSPYRPLVWYSKLGSGYVAFSAFQADKHAFTDVNSKNVFQSLVNWSIDHSSSHPSTVALSEDAFHQYMQLPLLLIVVIGYASFSIHRLSKKKFSASSLRVLLSDSRGFIVSLFIFILNYFSYSIDPLFPASIPFSFLITFFLLGAFFYDFNLFHFVKARIQSRKQNLISVGITIGWSFLTYFVIAYFAMPGILQVIPETINSIAFLNIGNSIMFFVIVAPLVPALALVLRRYVSHVAIAPDNKSQFSSNPAGHPLVFESGTSIEDPKVRKRQVYAIGCYLIVTAFISNFVWIGLGSKPILFSAPDIFTLLAFVFMAWQIFGLITRRQTKGDWDTLSKVAPAFLTKAGLIYFYIWVVFVLQGALFSESTIFSIFEKGISGQSDLGSILPHLVSEFYLLIFPSYMIYSLAKRHEMGDVQDNANLRLVLPYFNIIFLALYALIKVGDLTPDMTTLIMPLAIVNAAAWLLIHLLPTKIRLPAPLRVVVTPRLEIILVSVLLISFSIGIIGYMSNQGHAPDAIGLAMVIFYFPMLSFYFTYKWYHDGIHKIWRTIISVGSLFVLALWFNSSMWWIGFVYLLQVLVIQDS